MYRIFGPHGGVIVKSATLARVRALTPRLRRRFGRIRIVNLLLLGKPATMYDSVRLTEIPNNAAAVAGYMGGKWPTYHHLAAAFPRAKRLSIAVSADEDADCLDVEPHDAVNAQAPAWVRRQQARGVKRPVVYTSVSNAHALLKTLGLAGVSRGEIRLWTAHYDGKPHVCTPACGWEMATVADATQFTDRALGRELDESVCRRSFWP